VGSRLPPPSERAAWVQGPGGRTLDVALPVPWEGPPRGWLRIALAAEPVETVLLRQRGNIVLSTALVLVVASAALFALARMERLRRAEEERLLREIERRERFAALGQMAGGVAHEIRGPLNAISLSAQMLSREAGPEDPEKRRAFDEHIASLGDAVRRVDATVSEFLALGRGGRDAERRDTDMADVVGDALAQEGGKVALEPPAAPVRLSADRGLLARALGNLVRNARQCAPPESVKVAWRRDGRDAVVEVMDGGPGIPAAERARIFEPFHTTRRDGTGLGLTIAKEAVERHGGTIAVDEAPGGGARFRIRLPAAGPV
jgi:two-component system sensor histidine kinase HydH